MRPLLAPQRVALPLGDGATAAALRTNLAGFAGASLSAPTVGFDLALVAGEADPAATVAAWAAAGAGVVAVYGSARSTDGAACAAAVRGTRTRLLGPGTLGLALPWLGLNATPMARAPRPGHIAALGQSGALLGAILDWSAAERVGFSAVVCAGQLADVGWAELLDHCADDHRTRAIIIGLEHAGDAGALLSAVRAVALRKPVVVLHQAPDPGRYSPERAAALDAALARVGALGVQSLADLVNHAEVLALAPPARGPRLTIIANAGGPAVLAAQEAWQGGLVPTVMDLGHGAGPAEYAAAVAEVEGDGVLVLLAPLGLTAVATRDIARALAGAKRPDRPLLSCFLGGPAVSAARVELRRAGLPEFPWPEGAVRAFIGLWRHGERLAALYETPDEPAAVPVRLDPGPGRGPILRLAIHSEPGLGPILRLGPGGPGGNLLGCDVWGVPPLTTAQAADLVARAPAARALDRAQRTVLARLCVQAVSQAVEDPRLATLIIDPLQVDAEGGHGVMAHTDHDPALSAANFPRPAIRQYPREHESCALLPLGGRGMIRPLRPDDEAAVAAFHRTLSTESVRLRWFHPVSLAERTSHAQLVRVCHVDWRRELVLALFVGDGPIAAIGRLNRGREPEEAELALIVGDRWQRHGIGRALMAALVAAARSEGLRRLTIAYLPENQGMGALARAHGFVLRRDPDDDAISGELRL